jgi:phosphohistidine phosphatase
MRLILVRHAEAVPLFSENVQTDFQRPLTEHGQAQANALAQVLLARDLRITTLITSPLVRAIQTTESLHAVLTPGQEYVVSDWLGLGELKPKRLSKLVFETGGTSVLVGHMPDIATYAAWLLGTREDAIEFEKAAAACINCREAIGKGTGVLEWLVTPEWYLSPPQKS